MFGSIRLLTFSLLGLCSACGSTQTGAEPKDAAGGTPARGGAIGTDAGASGSTPNGGNTTVGNASGGNTNGGASNGDVSKGGVSNGGVSNGGASNGGASNGGASNAGAGGARAAGGATAGSSSAGGAAMGGAATSSGGATTSAAGTGSGATAGSSGSTGSGNPGGVVGEPIGFATLNGGTTGGRAGKTVTVSSLADLQKYAASADPLVILVQGTLSNGSTGAKLRVASNKSIVGVGQGAFLSGIGIEIANSNNVILQNLKVTLVGTSNPAGVNGGDAMVINGTSKNVWIDHCELYSEDPEVQTDIDKYDGLIDIRDQTGFITVSWNYIHDHHKACLVGAADSDIYADRKITYHHNHFHKIVKRMPMYRGSVGHFFNNYVYGTSATEATFALDDTCLRVEKNIYENVHFSIYSQTGSTAGKAERIDNIESQSRAYPSSCSASIPYEYASALTSKTADVKAQVSAGAGVGKL